MKKLWIVLLVLFFGLLAFPLFSQERAHTDWDDLDRDEHKIFGSEKIEKYRGDLGCMYKEEWKGHESCMCFWIFYNTDYPKYTLSMLWPFYYNKKSKIDNRKKTYGPLALYYNKVDGPEEDTALFWLFWYGKSGGVGERKETYNFIFPLYTYKSKTSVDEQHRHWRFFSLPLLYLSKGTTTYPDRTVENVTNWSLLHYYESRFDSKDDKTYRTWWVPILPLTFHKTTPFGGHRNFFWVIDYEWKTKNNEESLTNAWIFPLYFWKPGSDGHHFIAGIYWDNRHSDGRYSHHLLPFFRRWQETTYEYSPIEKKTIPVHSKGIYGLFGYNEDEYTGAKKWEGDLLRSTLWWPIIPVYYSHYDKTKGTHRNKLWVYDTFENTKGEVTRRWFAPFFFWKQNSYLHIPIALYFNTTKGKEETTLFPLGYYSNTTPTSSTQWRWLLYWADNQLTGEKSAHCFPIYFSWEDKNEKSKHVPIFFHNWETKDSSTYYIINTYSYTNRAKGESSFHPIPLWFYWNEDNQHRVSTTLLIPPLLWYSQSTVYAGGEVKTKWSPFFYSHSDISQTKEGAETNNGTRFWFPGLPIVYSSFSSAATGMHRTFLIFDWKRDNADNLTRFIMFPFIFHETREYGYRYYFPFYVRPGGASKDAGLTFGLFPIHYYNWTPDRETEWSWLLYFNFKRPEWQFKTVFPIYASYQKGDYNWDIWFIFYAYKLMSGPKPSVSLGLGKNEKGNWYLDLDASVLLYLLEWNSRISLVKPWKNPDYTGKAVVTPVDITKDEKKKADKKIETASLPKSDPNTAEQVSFLDKISVNRDTSDFFFGWSFLRFVSYQRADDTKYFRLFPFLWFKWGENSEDVSWKSLLIITSLSYTSKDKKDSYYSFLFLIFPIWGDMHQGESYKKVRFLNAYWDEYDAQHKYREKSVLWPIINWYSSPVKAGWRVAPFVWRKQTLDNGIESSKWITPVAYSNRIFKSETDETIYNRKVNPLFYYKAQNENNHYTSTLWWPIIPVYYKSEDRMTVKENLPALPLKEPAIKTKAKDMLPMPAAREYTTAETASWFLPLYYHTTSEKDEKSEGKLSRESSWYWIFLTATSSKTVEFSPKDGKDRSANNWFEYSSRYLLLMSFYSTPEMRQWSFLFGLLRNTDHPKTKEGEFEILFGLYTRYRHPNQKRLNIFPIYSSKESPDEESYMVLLGALWRYKKDLKKSESYWWGPLWIPYHSYEYSTRSHYINRKYTPYKISESFTSIWPLTFAYQKNESLDPTIPYYERTHGCLLWYYNYEQRLNYQNKKTESTFWLAPIIPLMGYSSTNNDWAFDLLGIFYQERNPDQKNQLCRNVLFPLWWYKSTINSWSLNIGLLLFDREKDEGRKSSSWWFLYPLFWNETTERSDTTFIFPVYSNTEKDYYRNHGLLTLLWDYQNYPKLGKYNWGIALNLFQYEYQIAPEISQWKLMWGILTSYKNYRGTSDYEFDILGGLVFNLKQRNERYTNSLLLGGVYYYSSHRDDYTFFSLPLLTYSYHENDITEQYVGLGIIRYKYDAPKQNYYTNHFLLGLPYLHYERPERGYSSTSSLWTVLWEYEKEKETGFERLRIGKFLFDHITNKGKTQKRLLYFIRWGDSLSSE